MIRNRPTFPGYSDASEPRCVAPESSAGGEPGFRGTAVSTVSTVSAVRLGVGFVRARPPGRWGFAIARITANPLASAPLRSAPMRSEPEVTQREKRRDFRTPESLVVRSSRPPRSPASEERRRRNPVRRRAPRASPSPGTFLKGWKIENVFLMLREEMFSSLLSPLEGGRILFFFVPP